MKQITKQDVETSQANLKIAIDSLVTTTVEIDDDSRKRTHNYLQWLNTKTDLVVNEKTYTCNKINDVRRGSVVWVDFGFNIGTEFGGRHPAIVLRRTGQSIFVIPLSSQAPAEKKSYHVKIERVFGFKNMIRWANVLKIKDVSIQRVDFSSSIGNVKGSVLDEINNAIKVSHIY